MHAINCFSTSHSHFTHYCTTLICTIHSSNQITWEDGFNQVAPFEVLASLESQKVEDVMFEMAGMQATAELL